MFDGYDLKTVALGQIEEPFAAGPVARFVQDFAEHAGRVEAGDPGQIDSRFRVAGPPQDATLLGHERKKVARSHEIGWTTRPIRNRADRIGSFAYRDPRAATAVIDRYGEIRT